MNTLPCSATDVGPVTQTDRIASIDVLRGFAVLGILVMNIQSFSLIGATTPDPRPRTYPKGGSLHSFMVHACVAMAR